MRIIKIKPKQTDICESCNHNHADFKIDIGFKMPRFMLCKDCAWNLSELLDKTTDVNFTSAEK